MKSGNILILSILFVSGCAANAPQQSSEKQIHPIRVSNRSVVVVTSPSISRVPASVRLAWSANEMAETYNIYYGMESRGYAFVIPCGSALSNSIALLQGGVTYYFAVTALDSDGNESVLSDEVVYRPPVTLDLLFTFDRPVTNVVLQSSHDLTHWNDLGTIPANGTWRITSAPSVEAMFYRGKATLNQ